MEDVQESMKDFMDSPMLNMSEYERQFEQLLSQHRVEGSLQDMLRDLSLNMLLSENQKKELRFAHMLELVLETNWSQDDASPVLENSLLMSTYDAHFGALIQQNEFDFQNIPYLSWLQWNENTYRVFSGTYSDSELYLADKVIKGCVLDKLLSQKMGFTYSAFLDLVLPRIHKFITLSGLERNESHNISDSSEGFKYGEPLKQMVISFEKCFVFPKSKLSESEVNILSAFSKKAGSFKASIEAIIGSCSEAMGYPFVEFEDRYLLIFPQFLISALFTRIESLFSDEEIAPVIRTQICTRAFESLAKGFGREIEDLVMMPTVNGQVIADIGLVFDRKVLLFTAFTPYSPAIAPVIETSISICSQLLNSSDRVLYGRNRRHAKLEDGPIEFMFFAIIDDFDDRGYEAFVPSRMQEAIFDVLIPKTLGYICKESSDLSEFVKFFRMRHRAHQHTRVIETSGPNLDSYAIFKQGGWLLPTNAQHLDALLVDNHSFDSYFLSKLQKYRKEHSLVDIDGKPVRLKEHYPGCHLFLSQERVLAVFEWDHFRVELICENLPQVEDKFNTWHVAFDSLCYHFGTKKDRLSELFSAELCQPEKLRIDFILDVEQQLPITATKTEADNIVSLYVKVGLPIQEIFMAGNNEGERLVLQCILECIGAAMPDDLLPLSENRNFQLFKEVLPHSSWNDDDTKPIPIHECDDELVCRAEWVALSKAKIESQLFTGKKDLFKVLGTALDAVRNSFHERLAKYDRMQLIFLSYAQLEAAYIQGETLKKAIAFGSETAVYFDSQSAYTEANRNTVNLTFANRLILESALQMDSTGEECLTEETFSELLAFAHRVVTIDFQGDNLIARDRVGRPLPQVELTETGILRTIETDESKIDTLPKYLFDSHKRDLSKRFQSQSTEKSNLRDALTSNFDSAFKELYGCSLTQRFLFDGLVLSMFDEREIPMLSLPKTELAKILLVKSQLSEQDVQSYLEWMTLSRDKLKKIGVIKPSENYWRESRIMNKPLILLEDDTVLLSRSVVHFAQQILVERLNNSRADEETSENEVLQPALSTWANIKGEEFKNYVIELLQESHWEACSEISALNGKSMPDLGMGPIDIVALKKDSQTVLVIETKRNYFNRNPKDLLNEIDNFHGTKKKKGEFQRFAEKIDWFQSDLNDVAKRFNLQNIQDWKIQSIFITTEHLLCASMKDPGFNAMNIDEFSDWLLGLNGDKKE